MTSVYVSLLQGILESNEPTMLTYTYLFLMTFAVEELTCLATWKDGNSRYLVGLVSHHHAISNEERYRCFVYKKISSLMGMANLSFSIVCRWVNSWSSMSELFITPIYSCRWPQHAEPYGCRV